MSDADDGGDSDVVADTYGVSAGQSRFSAGRGSKRLKVDDAPTSASTLSEEQARVRDLVLAGKNVRHPACLRVCAQALGCAHAVRRFRGPRAGVGCQRRDAGRDGRAQVFFTGSAGVGKSWLIAHIIGLLRERYGEVRPMSRLRRLSPCGCGPAGGGAPFLRVR